MRRRPTRLRSWLSGSFGLALLGGVLLILGVWAGCRSSGHQPGPQATQPPATADTGYEDTMADADAERAKAAIERDWPKGERRPAQPPRRPAVDQPRRTR